jgi:predicted house-cleaning noncanonical NTP pyrophosphatase (MazG superfamily)
MPVVFRTLARDRIPEIIQSEDRRPVTRAPDEASYREALLAKLIEEAQQASHATAGGLPGELAGVLEVPRALTVTTGMAWPLVHALGDDNRSRRGGFARRIFLESVE